MKTLYILAVLCLSTTFITAQSKEVKKYKAAVGIRLNPNEIGVSTKWGSPMGGIGGETIIHHRFKRDSEFFSKGYFGSALINYHIPITPQVKNLTVTVGAGGLLGAEKAFDIVPVLTYGLKGNIGIDYFFSSIPVNISLDWTPRVRWINSKVYNEKLPLSRRNGFGLFYISARIGNIKKWFLDTVSK